MGGKLKKVTNFLDPLGLFSSADAPRLESSKVAEVQQIQAPQEVDNSVAQAAAEDRRRRQAGAGQGVLTSGAGAAGQPLTAKKTLLG